MKIEKPMDIAALIDHTLLKANAKSDEIKQLCKEADNYGFASVCINPVFIPLAVSELKNSKTKVCTVIGFPLGANLIETKESEARECVQAGAEEVDMVINISRLIEGDYDYIGKEIETVRKAIPSNIILKVIIETCYLNEQEIEIACKKVVENGADFVKTSTGFGSGGATVKAVSLMKKTVGDRVGVKASGGIRDYETALEMIKNGATRLGTSSGIKIIGMGNSGGNY